MTDPFPIGFMQWRDLVFLHWPVPLARLGPLVPPELTIETWRGVAYVSLVAFHMRARPVLAPDALALEAHEVNLRTYVRYKDQMAGIYFLSLDTDSWLAVGGARALFGLPSHDAAFARHDHGPEIELSARRQLGSPAHFHVRYAPGKPLGEARRGTLAHFLLERYALYVDRALSLWRVQVRHPAYPMQKATLRELAQDVVTAAGLPSVAARPRVAHYAYGVDVDVLRPELVAVRSPVTTRTDDGSRATRRTRIPVLPATADR